MSTAVIGAPEFRARSGRTVQSNEDGSVTFEGVRGYIAPEQVFDAQEFFQAQRDLELGRWRWPENPDYVVYRRDAYPAGTRRVRVINERSGDFSDTIEGSRFEGVFKDAARAYFEAHPERKAWEDAKPGEAWLLTVNGTEGAYLYSDNNLDAIWLFAGADGHVVAGSDRITDGRRIWPEDAS